MDFEKLREDVLNEIFAERFKFGHYPEEEIWEAVTRKPTRPPRISTGTPKLPTLQLASVKIFNPNEMLEGESLLEMTPTKVSKLLFAGPFSFKKVPGTEDVLPIVPEEASEEDLQKLRPIGKDKNLRCKVKIIRPNGRIMWLRIKSEHQISKEKKQLKNLFG